MKQTILVKLNPDEQQFNILKGTMERFNDACNYIAEAAFQNKVSNNWQLHHLVYYKVRERFGLSAQMTVRAISKVVETYKRHKKVKHKFTTYGAIVYDERLLSWKGLEYVSILTIKGRLKVPIRIGPYQEARMDRLKGQVDLLLRNAATFYLAATIDMPEPTPYEPKDWLGVDLGVKNIAVDNDGETWSGGHLNGLRNRHAKIRTRLQSKGTKSAKHLLKKRGRRERRFATAVNHFISKRIVEKAKDTLRGVVLEDLKGIRSRVTVNGSRQRRTIHSWAFRQLQTFIEYKAKVNGVPVLLVDPRKTSQTCPRCGYASRSNRKGESFLCQRCGYAGAADYIAAENIRRVAVNRPNVSKVEHFLFPPSGTSPWSLAVGS